METITPYNTALQTGRSAVAVFIPKGLIVKGTIRCQWCHVAMDETRGVCPKCGRATCYINWYDQTIHKARRIFADRPGVPLGYASALDKLLEINREYREAGKSNSPIRFDIRKWTDPGDHLTKHVLNLWIESKHEENRQGRFSPGSLHTYESYIRNYYKPILGEIPIYELDTDHLEMIIAAIPPARKIKYKRCVLFAFHNFLKWARQKKHLRKDVPEMPTLRGDDSEPTQALDITQQEAALDNIPDQHRDVFEFAAETGLRSGAYSTLRIIDINVFNRTATVRRTESDRKIWEHTKSRKIKEKRLSDQAYDLAVKHMRGRTDVNDWLFINPDTGHRYTVQGLWKLWKRHSGTTLPPHQAMRHSYATQGAEIIAQLGLPAHYLQELLDHADPRTTAKYTHIRDSVMNDLVNQRQKIVQLRKGEK
jgi:integrase/RNA polymerase subunit RPABC4/transcription elongation factor Spt4